MNFTSSIALVVIALFVFVMARDLNLIREGFIYVKTMQAPANFYTISFPNAGKSITLNKQVIATMSRNPSKNTLDIIFVGGTNLEITEVNSQEEADKLIKGITGSID